jgi:acyl carrier protein
MEVAAQIRSFIVTTFLFGEGDKLANADSLRQSGVVDSTGVLDLLAFLEERYDITVADAELVAENFDSIDKIAAFVARRLAAPGTV